MAKNNLVTTGAPGAIRQALCFFCILLSAAANAQTDLQQLVYQRQYATALEEVLPLHGEDSTDMKTMYAVGQAYEGLLRYREAYGCYRHCLSLGEDGRIDLLNAVARMAFNIGMTREAEDCYLQALVIDSTDFYANHQLARLYFQSEEYTDAIHYYNLLLKLYPNHPVLLRGMGDCYSRMNFLPVAAAYYRMFFDSNTESVAAASTLVNTLLMINQTEDAVSVCDTALVYNPGDQTLYRHKGMALFTARQYEAADSVYAYLLEQGDSSYMTIKYSAFSRYYTGKYMDAINLFETAYRMDTTAVDVSLYFGSTLGRTYDRRRAYRLLDHAEVMMQPNPALVSLLTQFRGETYARDGRPDQAAAMFYDLWEKAGRAEMLEHIRSLYVYDSSNIAAIKDENRRSRALFIYTLIASEYDNIGKSRKSLMHHVRAQLQTFQEEMFMEGKTEFPMLSPDGRKSVLSIAGLQELILRLPESPE